jgi:hypothetical protein
MYAIPLTALDALSHNQDPTIINTQLNYGSNPTSSTTSSTTSESTSDSTSDSTSRTTQVRFAEEKELILWGKKINPQAYSSNILWGVQACKSRYRATYNSLVDFRRAMGVPASRRGAFSATQIIKMDCGWVATRMQNPRMTRKEFLRIWEEYLSKPAEGRLIEYFLDVYRVSFPEYLVSTQPDDFLDSLPVSAVLVYCSAYLNQKQSSQETN